MRRATWRAFCFGACGRFVLLAACEQTSSASKGLCERTSLARVMHKEANGMHVWMWITTMADPLGCALGLPPLRGLRSAPGPVHVSVVRAGSGKGQERLAQLLCGRGTCGYEVRGECGLLPFFAAAHRGRTRAVLVTFAPPPCSQQPCLMPLSKNLSVYKMTSLSPRTRSPLVAPVAAFLPRTSGQD